MTILSDLHSFASVANLVDTLPEADSAAVDAARARQNSLTKPPASLGRLEDLAEFMASWQ
ncbi:MAG: nicotinate-nucleotide--dimethylbenzimidazole phosphoribosyltransferase, partial [Paracoccaceae bacterium]